MRSKRLLEMIWFISQKNVTTAGDLARHFHISTRTVYRDIDLLCASGVPIISTKGKNGGISLPSGFVMDKKLLNTIGKINLSNVLESISPPPSSPTASVQHTQQKPEADWIEVSFSTWKDSAEQDKYNRIKESIFNHSVLEFDYFNSLGQKALRTAHPHKLVFKGSTWYMFGFCPDKQDFRFFKISRIRNLRVLKQTFEPSPIPENIFEDEPVQNIELVSLLLKIDGVMAYRVMDEFENFVKNSDKSFTVQIQLPPGEWMYSYLMSFGDSLEVLKPESLRGELKRRFEAAAKKYE